MEEGKIHLEDKDDVVELEFTEQTVRSVGMFNFGCFVLVEGLYTENSVILVEKLSMPMIAPRRKTDSIFSIDYFSGKPNQGVADLECMLYAFNPTRLAPFERARKGRRCVYCHIV